MSWSWKQVGWGVTNDLCDVYIQTFIPEYEYTRFFKRSTCHVPRTNGVRRRRLSFILSLPSPLSFDNMMCYRSIWILFFLLLALTNGFHVAPSTRLRPVDIGSQRQQTPSPVASSSALFTRSSTPLQMSDSSAVVSNEVPPDPLIVDTSEVLGRVSWLSWWAQVILTVIASVTLLFARNVTLSATPQNNSVAATIGPGYVLAGSGV